ncbi:MAG: glycosyltransferase family 4 protein [bacterium]
MRVLMLNAFLWLKGGVERTVFDETRWLEAAGHEVAHFATQDPRNQPSPFARHFAPPADFGADVPAWRQLSLLPHTVWSRPAARALAGLLAEWRPDVAHVHAPSRHLTPSVIEELTRQRVPVVMTSHDWKPWCTNRLLYAHGRFCDRCRGGHHVQAVLTGCVQGSRAKSVIGAYEAYTHDRRDAYGAVRTFIAPSRYSRDMAVHMGADPARFVVLGHGVDTIAQGDWTGDPLPERYALFVGRLSDEKGIAVLPEVARRIAPVPLWVVGDGPSAPWLRAHAPANLRMLGRVTNPPLAALRTRATVAVVPSTFPETFGYTVAEAMLDARPLVASRIGAVPELVEHEVSGLLVPPGDGAACGDAVRRALDSPADAARWAQAARARLTTDFTPERHLNGLLAVYESAIRAAR